MQQLYDSHLLLQAYEDFQKDPKVSSDAGRIIVSDLGLEESELNSVMQQLTILMEEGTICSRRQPSSYDDTLDMLSHRLSEI